MYCIWLTFDSPDIFEIIADLATNYNSPLFQPHCTIIGKTDKSLQRLKSAVVNLASNSKLIDVHPVKISYTANLWRALYIELKEKDIVTNWHKDACDSLNIECDNDYLPHISLVYKSISVGEKEKIINKIKLKSEYKIQSIQIIDCSEKVEEWRTVFELKS